MECPTCHAGLPEGVTVCACAQAPVAMAGGRPNLSESVGLPPPPRGLGVNGNMLVGAALFVGGVALLFGPLKAALANLDHRNVIAWIAIGVGAVRFLRGWSQSAE